jgi:coiled-coil domain-containing protein 55
VRSAFESLAFKLEVTMASELRRQEPENKKQKLAFGLNDRQQQQQQQPQRRPLDSTNATTAPGGKNVLMDGSDDDDDDDHDEKDRGNSASQSYRSRVNRDLRREQEALRRRAELLDSQPPSVAGAASSAAAVGAADGTDLYDYDGSYEAFQAPGKQPAGSPASAGPRKSRYVGELLKAAEVRQRERELRIERKVAKEQAEEAELDASLGSKDRFVTSAYKRALQERDLWVRDQQAKEAQEERADVTSKRNASLAMSSFYSNLNRNVAMGGGGTSGGGGGEAGQNDVDKGVTAYHHEPGHRSGRTSLGGGEDAAHPSGTFLDGFERPSDPAGDDDGDDAANTSRTNRSAQGNDEGIDPSQAQRRQARERKVEQARARYLERHPDRRREAAAAAAAL